MDRCEVLPVFIDGASWGGAINKKKKDKRKNKV